MTWVIVGMGELGGVFAHALLRRGHTVVPALRGQVDAVVRAHPDPSGVLVCVGETELEGVLSALPAAYRARVALVQNELRGADLARLGVPEATVLAVWFEKKRGTGVKPLLPTVAIGPLATELSLALATLAIPTSVGAAKDRSRVLAEKNVYILTTNIVGLAGAKETRELQGEHAALTNAVLGEIVAIEQALAERPLDPLELHVAFQRAIDADPTHGCAGRTAGARLTRAIRAATSLGLEHDTLRRIAAM